MARHQRDLKLEHFWRRHLQRQRASNMTVRAYCRDNDLREPAFYAWRRIIAQRDAQVTSATIPAPTPPVPTFLPVTVVDSHADRSVTAIDIRLAEGHRLRVRSGCDLSLLADVVTILRSTSESRRC